MDVAGMEAEDDSLSGFVEHARPLLDRPVSAERPGVELQRLGRDVAVRLAVRDTARRVEVLLSGVTDVGLRRAQVCPVGLRLEASNWAGRTTSLLSEQAQGEHREPRPSDDHANSLP